MLGFGNRFHCLLLFIQIFQQLSCQESAHYLQSAVRDLTNLNRKQNARQTNTGSIYSTSAPSTELHLQRRAQHIENSVPPLSLTKGELAALYGAAVAKGQTVNLDTGDNTFAHAAVHEINDNESESKNPNNYRPGPYDSSDGSSDDATGYYYYYYPIKSFLNEMTSQVEHSASEASGSSDYSYHKPPVYKESPKVHEHTTYKPPYQYHSHMHQHNVTIKTQPQEDKTNKLEPFLMAISGFAGMAVMFLLSVIVFPKLGIKTKPKMNDFTKKENIEDFARFTLKAIEENCAERFACELSKTARTFNLQDNRFLKLLKRMAPGTFGKHIERVRNYANKQLTCTAIPCKQKINKNENKDNNNQKRKTPNQKKLSKPKSQLLNLY